MVFTYYQRKMVKNWFSFFISIKLVSNKWMSIVVLFHVNMVSWWKIHGLSVDSNNKIVDIRTKPWVTIIYNTLKEGLDLFSAYISFECLFLQTWYIVSCVSNCNLSWCFNNCIMSFAFHGWWWSGWWVTWWTQADECTRCYLMRK